MNFDDDIEYSFSKININKDEIDDNSDDDKTKMKSKIKKNENENNIENKNKLILEPVNMLDIININILKEYVKKDIESNKEYYDDLHITYKISNPKKAEWILSKSIKDCKLVGDGNTNIDIIINNIGIDVSVLTLNNNNTNEKSIMQNFANSSDLDTLFNINNVEKAVEIFKNKLIDKYKFSNNIDSIYYLIFICKDTNIYLSCLKLNPVNIINMKSAGLSDKGKTIAIDKFIDKKFGNVLLYKSKKRLELRLSKDIINHTCSIKLF